MNLLPTLSMILAAAPSGPTEIYVERDGFVCLLRNIDGLIGRGREIRVDIARCPPVIVYNYTVWGTHRIRSRLELSDEQLRCLRAHRRNLGAIARDLGNGTVALRLSRCPRS